MSSKHKCKSKQLLAVFKKIRNGLSDLEIVVTNLIKDNDNSNTTREELSTSEERNEEEGSAAGAEENPAQTKQVNLRKTKVSKTTKSRGKKGCPIRNNQKSNNLGNNKPLHLQRKTQ